MGEMTKKFHIKRPVEEEEFILSQDNSSRFIFTLRQLNFSCMSSGAK